MFYRILWERWGIPDWQVCVYPPKAWHGPLTRVLNVWVAPLTGATPFLLAQERCAKEGHPAYGFRFAQLPSLRCRSGGRLTWAIPGPLSGAAVGISPHPCGSSPSATPALGPLTGPRSRACEISTGSSSRRLFFALALALAFELRSRRRRQNPLQEAEWNRRVRGRTGSLERHGCRESRDGPGMALRGVPLER